MSIRKQPGNKQDDFDGWSEKVGLLTEIRQLDDEEYQHTPEALALKALLSDSKVIPKWLTDLESPAYYSFKCGAYKRVVTKFTEMISESDFRISDNNPASTQNMEVSQCLQHILTICIAACNFDGESIEANKRCCLDGLLLVLWKVQTLPKMDLGQRHLRIPEPSSSTAVIPDSSVFLTVDSGPLDGILERAREGCCIMHTPNSTTSLNILHWITEYKRELGLDESRRQADNTLPSMTTGQNSDMNTVIDNTPVLHQSEGARDQSKMQDNKAKLVNDLNQRNKIAVYRLGIYSMRDPVSMLSYYLLMRSSRNLALKYRDAIIADYGMRVMTVEKTNPKLFDWYNPPPKPVSRAVSKASSGSSVKRTDFLATTEHYASPDEMDSGYYNSESDDESDSTLPSDSDTDEAAWK
ncbi:unnamed protein product [Rhizoctonia solani]|uniref:Uncharacterized protein n=1 Tax=Rhizoctonia solani TaxID=456999 RepID=A0A8H2WX61_9AGAM|nr:unnamed protein product [Rhizoctonia solani]